MAYAISQVVQMYGAEKDVYRTNLLVNNFDDEYREAQMGKYNFLPSMEVKLTRSSVDRDQQDILDQANDNADGVLRLDLS